MPLHLQLLIWSYILHFSWICASAGAGSVHFHAQRVQKILLPAKSVFSPLCCFVWPTFCCDVHNFLFYKSGAAVRKEVQTSQQNKQNTNCSPRVKQEENKNICSELLPSCNTKKTKTFSQKRNNLNSEICWPWFDCDVVTFFFLSRVVRVLTRLTDGLTDVNFLSRSACIVANTFIQKSISCLQTFTAVRDNVENPQLYLQIAPKCVKSQNYSMKKVLILIYIDDEATKKVIFKGKRLDMVITS